MVNTHLRIHTRVCEFVINTRLQFEKQIQELYLKQRSIILCLKVNHHHMNQVYFL